MLLFAGSTNASSVVFHKVIHRVIHVFSTKRGHVTTEDIMCMLEKGKELVAPFTSSIPSSLNESSDKRCALVGALPSNEGLASSSSKESCFSMNNARTSKRVRRKRRPLKKPSYVPVD